MAYIPREHDIMCGQLMGFFNNHIGNRRFRKLVDFHIDERVFDLAEIRCESIMHILRNSGYRFVQISNDGKAEPVLPCESLRMVRYEFRLGHDCQLDRYRRAYLIVELPTILTHLS